MNEQLGADIIHTTDRPTIQSPESFVDPLLDRCWADHITAAGVVAGGIAAYMIVRRHYAIGAVFAGVAGAADFFDGREARRFAKRYPEAAAERQEDGEFHDQVGDRLRNTLIAGAIALSDEVPVIARVTSGAVAVAEGAKILGGGAIIANYRRKGGVGIPELPPSAPVGKESMWWVGGGLVSTAIGAALRKKNHSVASKFELMGLGLLGGGLVRMGQAALEYMKYMKEVSSAEKENEEKPTPNYKPHLGQKIGHLISRNKNITSV